MNVAPLRRESEQPRPLARSGGSPQRITRVYDRNSARWQSFRGDWSLVSPPAAKLLMDDTRAVVRWSTHARSDQSHRELFAPGHAREDAGDASIAVALPGVQAPAGDSIHLRLKVPAASTILPRRCSQTALLCVDNGPSFIEANCETSSAMGTLPCFGPASGMSGLPLVPRRTPRRPPDLTVASRPHRERGQPGPGCSECQGLRASHRVAAGCSL